MFCLWFLTSWEDRVMLSISASGFFWTLFNKVLPWKGCDAWVRFCQVCAQATRDLCQTGTGMELWLDGLAVLLGLQSGQEGLGRLGSALESISALPREHSVPLPWSCGQHSVSAWSKPSSGAQRRCLSSPSSASSRPACPKWQLTGAPWVPTALAAALIPAGCALSPQNRTGWDMRAPEAAGNFPSLW